MDALAAALARALGNDHVLTDPQVLAGVEVDWTGRWRGSARALVRPADPQQVSTVVSLCGEYDVPITVRGGGTGLVGGAVPLTEHRPVVLATDRLRRLDDVDTVAGQVTAGAGVPLATLQRHAEASGWEYAVDFGSRDSATVGGSIATNAGGNRAFAYGSTRAQVLGVEAVLADGSVVSRLGGLVKDNTGYDLAGLLVGSEGTLAVVTAARLRLHPAPRELAVAVLGVRDVAAALGLLDTLRRDVREVRAVELVSRACLDLVCRVAALPDPAHAAPFAVLVEAADVNSLAAALAAEDPAVGMAAAERARLWAYRDRVAEAIATAGVPHKLDVALPLAALPGFVTALPDVVRPHDLYLFGHLADGNMHVNVVGPAADDATVDDSVLELVLAAGGTVSAEHGIGIAKRDWLLRVRSAAEVAAMRAVKQGLDPRGLLGRGVLWV